MPAVMRQRASRREYGPGDPARAGLLAQCLPRAAPSRALAACIWRCRALSHTGNDAVSCQWGTRAQRSLHCHWQPAAALTKRNSQALELVIGSWGELSACCAARIWSDVIRTGTAIRTWHWHVAVLSPGCSCGRAAHAHAHACQVAEVCCTPAAARVESFCACAQAGPTLQLVPAGVRDFPDSRPFRPPRGKVLRAAVLRPRAALPVINNETAFKVAGEEESGWRPSCALPLVCAYRRPPFAR